mmetsp:Transcript_41694/g.46545  ORF Transcript_41694/g.46545 Transcript_41694/m.46545 type:complete len:114 (+) Transcript_41694:643-984(+)
MTSVTGVNMFDSDESFSSSKLDAAWRGPPRNTSSGPVEDFATKFVVVDETRFNTGDVVNPEHEVAIDATITRITKRGVVAINFIVIEFCIFTNQKCCLGIVALCVHTEIAIHD